ncbi:MAG TPA: glycosyltransferase family 39 protein [Terriglobales bacterium]|nr:glycosyltransferase family 39 protein [Terriglobales bacterium]
MSTTAVPIAQGHVTEKQAAVPSWSWAAVVLLFLVVYLGSAFSPALQDDADSTHAEAAREMLVRGDYVTLHVNGVRYLEKAPLPYWLVALSYRVFGVNEFAVRLPTVVAMFLVMLLGRAWARRAYGARAGIYAALFVATTAGYYLFTRIFIPDVTLGLLIAACLYFFLTALDEPRHSWRWYAGYASLALAALTKGLVALVFVGVTAALFLVLTGNWRRWREFRLASGLLLFFVIAAPWHLLAGSRNPHFFWFYFVNEHFLRFLGKRYPHDYNKVPAMLYWGLHLIWLFPWSLYLPVALRRITHGSRTSEIRRPAEMFRAYTTLICWIWAGIVLLFFAFSTNQEYYTLPAYLALLILIAGAMGEEELSTSKWLSASATVIAIVSLAAGATLAAGLWSSRNLPFVPDISTVLARHNLSEDTLSMSHILDLTGESFAALRLPAILAAFALVFGPAISLWLRVRRKHYGATWVMAIAMALFLVAAHVALERFGPYLSSKNLADEIAQQWHSGDQVAIYGDQAFGSSLLFYLRRPVYLVNGKTTSMWFGSTYPDAPKIFWDDSGLLGAWNSGTRIFLFVPTHQRAQVDALLPTEKFVVAESSGKIVYSNRR